ncbi:MAG: 6-carboxytetrahydropterin synthase QueD [Bacteroidales bacterium]|jgi:6-pyruvoyltetrahydropterin/6-carboxytetrahydropterin synthase|nr:6-carboxytetrahydropterin synthase QueD [Bacteroidales bacterium]
MLSITKIFSFEAAHALKDYNGACANIHGHSYRLEVSVTGEISSENGMLLDFHDLKKIVHTTILDKFDHALMLNSSSDTKLIKTLQKHFDKVLSLPFQPTSENLILHFAALLKSALPDRVHLKRIVLYETETSFVTYEE